MTLALTNDDGSEAYVRGVDVVRFRGWLVVEQLCLRKGLSSLW